MSWYLLARKAGYCSSLQIENAIYSSSPTFKHILCHFFFLASTSLLVHILPFFPFITQHSHTAMLDLGLAEESDGGLVALTPEVLVGQVEGIVELDGRVGLLGDGLEVGLGCREGRGGGTLLRTSSEGGGRASEEGEGGELHSSWCCSGGYK